MGYVHSHHCAVDPLREAAAAAGAKTKHSCWRVIVSDTDTLADTWQQDCSMCSSNCSPSRQQQ